MDRSVYELLKDISLQSEKIDTWEKITSTFIYEIKRRDFNQEQIRVINEILINEIGKGNKTVKDESVKNKWN